MEKFCPLGEKPQGSGCSRCEPDLQEIFPSRSSSFYHHSPHCNTTFHHNKMHRNEIFNHYTTTTTKKYTKNNLTFSPLRWFPAFSTGGYLCRILRPPGTRATSAPAGNPGDLHPPGMTTPKGQFSSKGIRLPKWPEIRWRIFSRNCQKNGRNLDQGSSNGHFVFFGSEKMYSF